jgi:hypothetical protein
MYFTRLPGPAPKGRVSGGQSEIITPDSKKSNSARLIPPFRFLNRINPALIEILRSAFFGLEIFRKKIRNISIIRCNP